MDWRIFLILLGVVLLGLVVLGVMYSREKAKRKRAEGKAKEKEAVVKRLVDEATNKELPSDEAVKRLNDHLNRWNANEPSGQG